MSAWRRGTLRIVRCPGEVSRFLGISPGGGPSWTRRTDATSNWGPPAGWAQSAAGRTAIHATVEYLIIPSRVTVCRAATRRQAAARIGRPTRLSSGTAAFVAGADFAE